MKTHFYIKVNRTGTVSVSKNRPNLDFDQVAVQCHLELPDVLFQKPQITAQIQVPENKVQPFTIDADTSNNVKDAIETATGLQVKLSVEQLPE